MQAGWQNPLPLPVRSLTVSFIKSRFGHALAEAAFFYELGFELLYLAGEQGIGDFGEAEYRIRGDGGVFVFDCFLEGVVGGVGGAEEFGEALGVGVGFVPLGD